MLVAAPTSLEDLRDLIAEKQQQPVAFVLPSAELSMLEAAVRSRCVAVFLAPLSADEKKTAARALATGSVYVTPALSTPLFLSWREQISRGRLEQLLSDREQAILELLTQGISNREIANRLFLSPHTVRNHLSRIYAKLDVDNREQASAVWRNVNPRGGAPVTHLSD